MLKVYPLFSSSSGNMYLIKSASANILIDIGVSYKKIVESLSSIDLSCKDIDAVCITHEHSDHIKGLNMFVKNNPNIQIYASCGTCKYLTDLLKGKNLLDYANISEVSTDELYKIKDITISCFNISHDALDPIGYKMSSEGKSLTLATDLGTMTDTVYSNLKAADFSIIESNYDKEMLLAGKYPFELKRRIQGNYGHLSNEDSRTSYSKTSKRWKKKFSIGSFK